MHDEAIERSTLQQVKVKCDKKRSRKKRVGKERKKTVHMRKYIE